MNISDIKIDSIYFVEYFDQNYPCRCECHTNRNILHCVPCCYDKSYTGLVQVIAIDLFNNLVEVHKLDNSFKVIGLARYRPERFQHIVNKEVKRD